MAFGYKRKRKYDIVKTGAFGGKNNGDSVNVKPGVLGGKNNGYSVNVKPVDFGVKKKSYGRKSIFHPKPCDMSSKTMGTSVHVKQGNPSDKTNGSHGTAKTKGHSVTVNPVKLDDKTKGKAEPNKCNFGEKSMSGKPVDLDGETNGFSKEDDWKFQSKNWKKKSSFEAQTTKVYNRFSHFEDEIEDDEIIEDTVAKNEDIECHGSIMKSEKVCVERKAIKENSTKRKKTSSKATNGDNCTESKAMYKKGAQRPMKSNFKTENKRKTDRQFETKNRFSLFETLTEREIEAIANYENHMDVSKVKKKCRRCNFRRYCTL